MQEITFITGNQKKADYLAKYLGFPVKHVKLDLDELQSLDLKVIVEHKVRQAYEKVRVPVLVEDSSLEFVALGRLPGTFVKFFQSEISFEDICRLVDNKSRKAIAKCIYGYYDGNTLKLFEGYMDGEVPVHPVGKSDFGWDTIFIPEGYAVTRAQLDEENNRKTYLQIKPLEKVKAFLESLA